MKIVTADQMRRIDRLATEKYGIPGILLMENAGMRVVEEIDGIVEELDEGGVAHIGILCGKGNNGGDGFAAARQLLQRGFVPLVYLFCREQDVRGDARVNLDILKAIGHPPRVVLTASEWTTEKASLRDADVIVDALLGTGLTKPAAGLFAAVIDSMVEDFPRATIVSIDLPSGLPADSGEPIGPAVDADVTVTFNALKPCLVLAPNHERAGDVIVADIGIPEELLDDKDLGWNLIGPPFPESCLQPRAPETHKGDYGRVLVIGGSRGKSGAAAMAGQAALRAGAGLVTVAAPASAAPIVAAAMPELMTELLPETASGGIARRAFEDAFRTVARDKSVIAIGPGIGLDAETQEFVRAVLAVLKDAAVPAVVDADGLNAFRDRPELLCGHDAAPVVITPHPGEMARLIGRDIDFVQANRVEAAREFAASHNLYVVLKGFRTVVAEPDSTVHLNPTGNPGMATGGTGDILTGMIAGIVAQEHLGSFVERLCLAVYLHGLSGDLAAEAIGEETLTATDLLRYLDGAWRQIRS